MKALRIISFVFLTLAFFACGDKDDEPASGSVNKELVGNWYDGDNYLISLKSNGTYKAYEYPNLDKGTYEDFWNGKWTYDKETKHLIMYWENTKDIEDEFYIKEILSDSFVTSEGYVFTKIPDSKLPTKYIRD